MTISEDIVKWASGRPVWQQEMLARLASGAVISDADIADVVSQLLEPTDSGSTSKPLELALPSSDEEEVKLAGISSVKGVNALVDEEVLDFALAGLNVVYGDNGSGKSGYARLIKQTVGARHAAEVLPDVFEDAPEDPQATLRVLVGDVEQAEKLPGEPDPRVKKIAFYDEHCGDAYLDQKSVVTYRPSALTLLDGLIRVCDRVRQEISSRLVENDLRKLQLILPPDTAAGRYLASLTAATTDEEISRATALDPDSSAQLATTSAEVARLEASDATKERALHTERAAVATRLKAHIKAVAVEIDIRAITQGAAELANAHELRGAAKVAATSDFSDELPGVGGATWRALWLAAREYSSLEAYHEQAFPATHDGARCVFCQQPLSPDAAARLRRFDRYMTDTTERKAAAAEAAVEDRLGRLEQLTPSTAASAADLLALEDVDKEAVAAITTLVATLSDAKDAAFAWLRGGAKQPAGVDITEALGQLESLEQRETRAASKVDVAGFSESLRQAQSKLREVQASNDLAQAADAIRNEVKRLVEYKALHKATTDVSTTSITAKSTQLTKEYAGDAIKNEFIRETERLRLQRVTIADLGGNKGQLEQQPTLLGAKASKMKASQVLSEGEQTAMGLAGFFTEATFDASKSALVLDDPVTSLDHVRRGLVAARLIELAKDRQVIVFTHDLVFIGELQRAAANQGVALTAQRVEQRVDVAGYVEKELPWKAKDFAARLHTVNTELARLRKLRPQCGQEEWTEHVGTWAGKLSELWESSVATEILDQVFDRATAETRPTKFRILASVTPEDDTDFQAGYGKCSKWALRHNKAPETNYVPPEPEEMQAEVDRITAWQKRVAKYRN